MAESLRVYSSESVTVPAPPPEVRAPEAGRSAYRILHVGFSALPFLAGADKFGNRLCDWPKYLAPQIPRLTGLSPERFMKAVGVIEMVAGAGVAYNPRLFSPVVAGWLGGIIGNLILGRKHYDVALRDFGLLLGALSLARLSRDYGRADRIALQ